MSSETRDILELVKTIVIDIFVHQLGIIEENEISVDVCSGEDVSGSSFLISDIEGLVSRSYVATVELCDRVLKTAVRIFGLENDEARFVFVVVRLNDTSHPLVVATYDTREGYPKPYSIDVSSDNICDHIPELYCVIMDKSGSRNFTIYNEIPESIVFFYAGIARSRLTGI